MKYIMLEAPGDYDDDQLKEFLHENEEELRAAMDMTAACRIDRAQVDEVFFDEISITKDVVTIEYTYEYSAYYGCRDANVADSDSGVMTGTRIGNKFIFEEFEYPPERTTFEEF